MQRSILGPLLPEAMVCYLENYESDRFAQIFLGEFDTPEAIWSSEMRCACPPVHDMYFAQTLAQTHRLQIHVRLYLRRGK